MTATFGVVIFTDGRRDCITRTVTSFRWAFRGAKVDQVTIINDAADPAYEQFLKEQFYDYDLISHPARRGFSGAVQSGWDAMGHHDFIFHLEDDFVFNEPVNLMGMAEVLDMTPELIQLALKRQPWNPEEKAAGGFMEMHPEAYTDEDDLGYPWCWQRLFFTTNPSLYRGSLTKFGWPQEQFSEGKFTAKVLRYDPESKFGFWGHRQSDPKVHHIGEHRVGTGY